MDVGVNDYRTFCQATAMNEDGRILEPRKIPTTDPRVDGAMWSDAWVAIWQLGRSRALCCAIKLEAVNRACT
jgi:hypothetical protein